MLRRKHRFLVPQRIEPSTTSHATLGAAAARIQHRLRRHVTLRGYRIGSNPALPPTPRYAREVALRLEPSTASHATLACAAMPALPRKISHHPRFDGSPPWQPFVAARQWARAMHMEEEADWRQWIMDGEKRNPYVCWEELQP